MQELSFRQELCRLRDKHPDFQFIKKFNILRPSYASLMLGWEQLEDIGISNIRNALYWFVTFFDNASAMYILIHVPEFLLSGTVR